MGRRVVFEEIPRRSIDLAARGDDPGGIYGQILERILERESAGETVFAWKVGNQVAVGPDPVQLLLGQDVVQEDEPSKEPSGPRRSTDLSPGGEIPLARPDNCRNSLASRGLPHPKSGCAVCGTGGLFGCPYDERLR